MTKRLVGIFLIGLVGCATVPQPYVECSERDVAPLVNTVAAALAATNWDKQLEALEVFGTSTLICAMEVVLRESETVDAVAAKVPQDVRVVEHAHRYFLHRQHLYLHKAPRR